MGNCSITRQKLGNVRESNCVEQMKWEVKDVGRSKETVSIWQPRTAAFARVGKT